MLRRGVVDQFYYIVWTPSKSYTKNSHGKWKSIFKYSLKWPVSWQLNNLMTSVTTWLAKVCNPVLRILHFVNANPSCILSFGRLLYSREIYQSNIQEGRHSINNHFFSGGGGSYIVINKSLNSQIQLPGHKSRLYHLWELCNFSTAQLMQ